MKQLLIHALNLIKKFPAPAVKKSVLLSLIEKLHPISTEKPLIRLGGDGDGGYLLPNDLDGLDACFSPGVSTESSFEKDCAELGMRVFMADKSVEHPADNHDNFNFLQKYVGAYSSDDFITLDDWVNSHIKNENAELLLQMDIEGYEYEVILSTSDSLMKKFRIIVAEFHHLDQLFNKPFYNIASRAFDKILHTHYCVHIHPNNCCGSVSKNGIVIPRLMEFTFIRKDRVTSATHISNFPNALDKDNTGNPTLTLPNCWYNAGA